MKNGAIVAGLFGIVISLTVQLFMLIDDHYRLGSIWFVGLLAGIVGIIGANAINQNNRKAMLLIVFSMILGFIGIGLFYFIPALIQSSIVYLLKNQKEKEIANLRALQKHDYLINITAIACCMIPFLMMLMIMLGFLSNFGDTGWKLIMVTTSFPFIGSFISFLIKHKQLKWAVMMANLLAIVFYSGAFIFFRYFFIDF